MTRGTTASRFNICTFVALLSAFVVIQVALLETLRRLLHMPLVPTAPPILEAAHTPDVSSTALSSQRPLDPEDARVEAALSRLRYLKATTAAAAAAAPQNRVPPSVQALQPVGLPTMRAELSKWFENGSAAAFKLHVDNTCLGALPGTGEGMAHTQRWVHIRSRDGLERVVPWLIEQSSYVAADARLADLAVVRLPTMTLSRNALSPCRRVLQRASASWHLGGGDGSRVVFVDTSERGRCCTGGQTLDPSLHGHHFLVIAGERIVGPRAATDRAAAASAVTNASAATDPSTAPFPLPRASQHGALAGEHPCDR